MDHILGDSAPGDMDVHLEGIEYIRINAKCRGLRFDIREQPGPTHHIPHAAGEHELFLAFRHDA